MIHSRMAALALALLSPLVTARGDDGETPDPPTVTVAQDGSADFNGSDETPILKALDRVGKTGGVVTIQEGTYLIRRPLRIPGSVVLRGTGRTVLQLPSPVLTVAAASEGARHLPVGDASQFAPRAELQVLPPAGSEHFEDGETELLTVKVANVEDGRLRLGEPLAASVPQGSRVGYFHNLIVVSGAADVGVERLTLDGGRIPAISMPGHQYRTAVWATARYSYAEGPLAPPVQRLGVRHCTIRNCYGRAVALYNGAESEVLGCRIRNIADEAIDFDHFCRDCRAVGNEVTGAVTGVTLNDASHCFVEHNRFADCGRGVIIWWWYKCPQEGLNEHNQIRHNTIRSSRQAAVSLGERCHHNLVEYNFIDGKISVAEESNTVRLNTVLSENEED